MFQTTAIISFFNCISSQFRIEKKLIYLPLVSLTAAKKKKLSDLVRQTGFGVIFAILIFYFAFELTRIQDFAFQKNHSGGFSDHHDISESKVNLQCPAPTAFTESLESDLKQKDSKEIDRNWYLKAIENIQKSEYDITYSEELGEYQSSNTVNNIRFIYHKDGFTAVPRQTSDVRRQTKDEWSLKLRVTNYELRAEDKLVIDGNKAHIENENFRIDYTNNEDGMRQDFIIKQKPQGDGKLRLNIGVDTKLKMIVGTDALMFEDKDGNARMKYSSLKCWDANGKDLRAYFETTPLPPFDKGELIQNSIIEANQNSSIKDQKLFDIVVNDENAVYPITVDPLSTSPNWTAEGNQENAYFGFSVSTAGDVNGDGYSDVIVGAYRLDRAYVYHGSASGLPVTANWTAEGSQQGSNFGWSVSSAGDVNGDGYSDVIVGAKSYATELISVGRAYVYYGSPSGLSATANWTAESNQEFANFGHCVSTAGDVNGDGYSDVIVSAPFYGSGQSNEGKAFAFYGSASGLSPTANWTAESNQVNAQFGYSVSTAGDVNSDGYSDVIVGAFRYDNGMTDNGRAYVYHGSPSGLQVTANWTAESNQASAFFGYSVSTAGDVNGDGYSDVIVGAILYTNGQTSEGRAFVFYGSASGLSLTANWSAESNQANAQFGFSVSTAGDVNGDGYSDVIIGARQYDNGQPFEGRAYVYHGSSSGLSLTANWTAESDQANAFFGYSVSTAGDINGDGFSDVIVGAYGYDNDQANEGRTFVYHGSALPLNGDYTVGLSMFNSIAGKNLYFEKITKKVMIEVEEDSGEWDENGNSVKRMVMKEVEEETFVPMHNGEIYTGALSIKRETDQNIPMNAMAGVYPNITAALNDLYFAGASGPVRFILLDSSYTNEPLPLIISAYNGASSVNTLTIKPNTGVTSTISGSNSTAVFDINNGSYFILDGSNTNGGTTKNLTVANGSALAPTIRFINDANNNVIRNCVIKGVTTSVSNGVVFFSTTNKPSGNDSNLILNNDITRNATSPFFCIYNNGTGTSSATKNARNKITGNRCYDFTSRGIVDEGNSVANLYEGNEIYSVNSQSGIRVGCRIIGTSIEGFTFRNNYIHDLKTSSQTLVYGMEVNSLQPGFTGEIYNNFISLSESNSNDIRGIVETTGNNVFLKIYHNTINVFGTITATKNSECYYRAGTGNTEFKNNILVNSRNGGTGKHYAIRTFPPVNNLISNYNDIYATGGTGNIFSSFNSTDIIDLAAWRSATGTDSYSISANPLFADNTNLHIDSTQSSPVNDAGTPIGVTTDIDNNIRSLTAPDIGADEFTSAFSPVTLNLKMFIEGFYNAGSNLQISDTVKIYLRNYVSPYALVDSAKTILSDSGMASMTFSNATGGTCYIVLTHRNSIETWSSNGIAMTPGSTVNYDFTNAASQSFGDNMKQVDSSPVRYAIYSGDENLDGNIDVSDIVDIYNDLLNGTSGYVKTDVNGDYFVDVSDLLIAYNNSLNVIIMITP